MRTTFRRQATIDPLQQHLSIFGAVISLTIFTSALLYNIQHLSSPTADSFSAFQCLVFDEGNCSNSSTISPAFVPSLELVDVIEHMIALEKSIYEELFVTLPPIDAPNLDTTEDFPFYLRSQTHDALGLNSLQTAPLMNLPPQTFLPYLSSTLIALLNAGMRPKKSFNVITSLLRDSLLLMDAHYLPLN